MRRLQGGARAQYGRDRVCGFARHEGARRSVRGPGLQPLQHDGVLRPDRRFRGVDHDRRHQTPGHRQSQPPRDPRFGGKERYGPASSRRVEQGQRRRHNRVGSAEQRLHPLTEVRTINKFAYRAYSPRGALEEKVVAGNNATSVHRDLLDRGYRVVSVKPARNGWRWIYRELPTFFRVSTADLVLFSRQLSTFLRVGVPITDAIKLLQSASGSGAFRAALEDICEDLDAGEAFSTSIHHHPSVFNELYVDMVRAAEYSGTLDKVLAQVAAYLQRQDTALKKLRSAMIYPAIILVLAIAVCTILLVFA